MALFAFLLRNYAEAEGLALSRLAVRTSPHPLLRRHAEVNNAMDCGISDNGNGNEDSTSYYQQLLSRFQGDFDNYEQVVQDRRHGLTPGDGGGHEHIHCMVVPCPHYGVEEFRRDQSQWLLAAFYFNANPRQIFRFRMYKLLPPQSDELPVRMKLNSLMPHLEQQLREYSDQPCMWWREVWNLWCKENNTVKQDKKATINERDWNEMRTVGLSSMVLPLDGCDVLWEQDWDESNHSYLYRNEYEDLTDCGIPNTAAGVSSWPALPAGKSCHAVMEAGSAGAIVSSISLIPGKRILIKDELSLWDNEFWINDRGYDPDHTVHMDATNRKEVGSAATSESMPFVYGNRRGVPYKLRRVSNFSSRCTEQALPAFADIESIFLLDRTIVNTDLKWTLGENYRTQYKLLSKMNLLDNKI